MGKSARDPSKPFIARDTKEPLVVIGGYHIGEGGGIIRQHIPPGDTRSRATEEDKQLLLDHGAAWLEEQNMAGVIDRLKTSGLIP